MYALIQSGQIASIGGLPAAARRIVDGTWLMPHDRQWTDQQAAACGYVPVVEVARPADTATHTSDLSHALIAGVPTQVWTVRPWTAGELADRLRETTRLGLDDKVRQAVKKNGTIDVVLGTADTKWVPGQPLTLRGLKALTKADLKTATYGSLADPLAEMLAKLAPALVDIAKTLMQDGKLTVQLYDDAT